MPSRESLELLISTLRMENVFNGSFKYIGWNSYVYLHNYHVAFSSIKYPEGYNLWKQSTRAEVATECTKHKSRHWLKPYFLDNRKLKHYLTAKLQGTTHIKKYGLKMKLKYFRISLRTSLEYSVLFNYLKMSARP